MIMGQQPRAVIIRTSPDITSGDLTYDNTSFQNTVTHVPKTGGIQRRGALARVISPTQCEIKIICDIDEFRGGELVYLKQWGIIGDGLWLISNALRSIFSPITTLTLVQAMQPLNVNSGLALGPAFATGKQATAPGTVLHAMISEASTINNLHVPYEYGGGRKQIGTPDAGDPGGNHVGGFGTVGFDCSGVVCAVLNAGGLWPKNTLGSDEDIISTLLANHTISPGQGSGGTECTLFDNPGVHIFMRLNGQIFGTSDGGGTPTSGGGSGGAWLTTGPDVGTFTPYHVSPKLLGQTATAVSSG
jgi:cell wall-associated NlpC family hydrolase